MILTKAKAEIYNKSERNIVLNDLGIVIPARSIVDIFKKNPKLNYSKYLASLESGSLSKKRHILVPVKTKPIEEEQKIACSSEPTIRRSMSAKGIGKEERDWISLLEDEFPADADQFDNKDAWNAEREKVLKEMQDMHIDDEGQVFSDELFNSDDDDFSY